MTRIGKNSRWKAILSVCLFPSSSAIAMLVARYKQIMSPMINVYGLFSLIRKKLVDIFLNLLVAVTNIYIIAMAMTFFFRQFDYSRVVLVYSAVFSFVLLAIWQYICHQWEWKYFPKQTAVLFAAGEEAARIQNKLLKTGEKRRS